MPLDSETLGDLWSLLLEASLFNVCVCVFFLNLIIFISSKSSSLHIFVVTFNFKPTCYRDFSGTFASPSEACDLQGSAHCLFEVELLEECHELESWPGR